MSHQLDPGSGINIEIPEEVKEQLKQLKDEERKTHINRNALVTWTIIFVTLMWAFLLWAGWNIGVVHFVKTFGENWPGMSLWNAIWVTVFLRATALVVKV
jgi:hypothetical protein